MLATIWKFLHLPKNLQLFIMRRFNSQFLIGATGIFFDKKNQILLVKHTYRGNGWSLPGGYVKSKEHPSETLEREVKEETNFTVAVDGRLNIRTDRETARLDIIYYGSFFGGVFKASNEVSQAQLFAFDQLPLLPKDQIIFIAKALKMREAQSQNYA
jgi:ADP-ribose pyrophosphatase YjhB (NUDIX family)